MRINKLFLVVLILVLAFPVFAAEIRAAEGEKSWGNTLGIGIPVGLYNEDIVVGLDFTIPVVKDNFYIRLEGHYLIDFFRSNELSWSGLKSVRMSNPVLLPSVGFIGKSPLLSIIRVYGGFFAGITYQTNNKAGPYVHLKGLGGIEIYSSRHQAFFLEAGGGGGIFKSRDIDYTRGVIISAGSRFFI
jgi:hypothetical protein